MAFNHPLWDFDAEFNGESHHGAEHHPGPHSHEGFQYMSQPFPAFPWGGHQFFARGGWGGHGRGGGRGGRGRGGPHVHAHAHTHAFHQPAAEPEQTRAANNEKADPTEEELLLADDFLAGSGAATPEEVTPEEIEAEAQQTRGPRGARGRRGRGGPGCGGGRGGPGFGGRGGHGHAHGHRGWGGPHGRFGGGAAGPQPFDLNTLLESLAAHPLAQAFNTFTQQASGVNANRDTDSSSFTPPLDVFSTETHFVLHVALAGAKKEDVGVNWDSETGLLNIAGVVYRPGNEEFIKTLSQSERKVGVFERSIKLPPGNAEKEEINGDAITARMEDGILIIDVPKVEKEWTEVKRINIL